MKQHLKKGEVYLASGGVNLRLEKGSCLVIGKRLGAGEQLRIPAGKRLPLEIIADTTMEVDFFDGGNLEKLTGRTIPAVWDELVEKVIHHHYRIVLVLGEIDTGKTFFSTYLANSLIERKVKVGIIDLDAGQSDIGPPGTLGLAVLDEPEIFLGEITPTAIYYIGSHSPGLHLLSSLVGLKRLVDKGLALCQTVIIDTPGWVQGDGGRLLRRSEIEMISPDIIVLMQRGRELEHLVKTYPEGKIVRLTVSKKASPTSPAERKGLRELISRRYFQQLEKIEIPFNQVAVDRAYLFSGQPFSVEELEKLSFLKENLLYGERLSGFEGALLVTTIPLSEEQIARSKQALGVFRLKNIVKGEEAQMVVGLADANSEVLGLGILKEIDYTEEKFVLLSPLEKRQQKNIRIIQFGSLRLGDDGREAGFVQPGYF